MTLLVPLMMLARDPSAPWSEELRSPDLARSLAAIEALDAARAGRTLLEAALEDKRDNVRTAAALAVGRLERVESLDALRAILTDDAEPGVREAAAFGLGQIAVDESAAALRAEGALIAALGREQHPRVRVALWRSLGRFGRDLTLAAALSAKDPADRPTALVTAGMVLRRLERKPDVFPAALYLESDPEVRAAALYAWTRAAPGELPPEVAKAALTALLGSPSAERVIAARVLRRHPVRTGDIPKLREALANGLLSAPEATLVVQALGTSPAGPEVGLDLLAAAIPMIADGRRDLISEQFPVLLAASDLLAEAPEAHWSRTDAVRASWASLNAKTGAEKRRVQAVLCRLSRSPSELDATCTPVERVRRAAALGQPSLSWLTHPTPAVRMAALEVAGALATGMAGMGLQIIPLAGAALSDPDLPVMATACTIFADLKVKGSPEVLVSVQRALAAGDLEVALDCLKAADTLDSPGVVAVLESLLTQPVVALRRFGQATLERRQGKRPALPEPPDPPFVRPVVTAAPRGLRVSTEVGEFEILFNERTPRTAKAIAALADRGFYKGLPVHRVVPDFVIQTGDPRGDGWGGPGTTLPCENDPTPYVTGTVGMALAGKDTGGSQWFVTHSAHPHLFGTYTAFGRVETKDQGIVDRLIPGDVVDSVVVLR